MIVADYVRTVNALVEIGGVGEHSIRGALIPHIRSAAANIETINEPAGTDHGNPDISIYKRAFL